MRTMESFERFMNDRSYDAMVKLRDQGKVRFIGISELSEADGTHEVLQHALPTGAFDGVMLTLNFLLQTAADTILSLAEAHDVGTVIMMPLNQASKESGWSARRQHSNACGATSPTATCLMRSPIPILGCSTF